MNEIMEAIDMLLSIGWLERKRQRTIRRPFPDNVRDGSALLASRESDEDTGMPSDAEFYLGEYEKCKALYEKCPYEERKRRELYRYMVASMWKAYVDATSKTRS